MTGGYEEDLDMYEESAQEKRKVFDNTVLNRTIREFDYPTDPLKVAPSATVREALDVMATRNIGAVSVVEDGRIVGIFAERDILKKRVFNGEKLDAPVTQLMTPEPRCLTRDDTLAMALNRMVVGGYRHIPVNDEHGKLVGMVVMRDIVRYIVSFFPEEVINLPPHSEALPPETNREGG